MSEAVLASLAAPGAKKEAEMVQLEALKGGKTPAVSKAIGLT